MFLSQFLRDEKTTLKSLSTVIYTCSIHTNLTDLYKFINAYHIKVNEKNIVDFISKQIWKTKDYRVDGQCIKFKNVSMQTLFSVIVQYEVSLENFIVDEYLINRKKNFMELFYVHHDD